MCFAASLVAYFTMAYNLASQTMVRIHKFETEYTFVYIKLVSISKVSPSFGNLFYQS
jgi:hypothetical protein